MTHHSVFIILLKTHSKCQIDQTLLLVTISSNVIILNGLLVIITFQQQFLIFANTSKMKKYLPKVLKNLNSYKNGYHNLKIQFGFQRHSKSLITASANCAR